MRKSRPQTTWSAPRLNPKPLQQGMSVTSADTQACTNQNLAVYEFQKRVNERKLNQEARDIGCI